MLRATRVAVAFVRRLTQHLAFWFALHGLIFLVFALIAFFHYPHTGELENQYALWMLGGRVPYADFASEYPPLALLSFLIPGLLFRSLTAYYVVFAVELLLFDLLAIALIARISLRLGIPVAKSLMVYTLLILAVGPIIAARYDIIPAVLVLSALSFFVSGKNKTAWGILGLAFMTKLYPIILVPVFILYQLSKRQYARILKGALAFAVVVLALAIPWLLLDASGFLNSFGYHLGRGLHSESTYGTALLIGKILGLTDFNALESFGSWNLVSPLAYNLAQASFAIMEGLLALVFLLYFREELTKTARNTAVLNSLQPGAAARLIRYSSAAILVFLLANKVFSPQYLIWLCPLLPMRAGRWQALLYLSFVIAAGFSQFVYPYHYIDFALGTPYLVAIMATRNFMILIATVIVSLPRPHRAFVESLSV